jgi:aryl-alcohol dehydrogenase-like predicted oxidoreductase
VRYVVERVEASLRATKLDVLPLVQLPLRAAWRGSSAWPELVGWCARIIREGKVLNWAVRVGETSRDAMPAIPRVHRALAGTPEKEAPAPRPPGSLIMLPDEAVLADPALAIAVELSRGTAPTPVADDAEVKHPAVGFFDEPWLTALAIDFAMCARDALALIASSKIPVLALHPLAGGALAGTLGPGSSLAPHDDRHALTPEQLEQIAVGVAKLASRVKREPLSARSCDAARAEIETTPRPPNVMVNTIAELALRYVIDRGTIPLPRIHTREALDELWAAGEAAPLPLPLIEKIEELLPQELDA